MFRNLFKPKWMALTLFLSLMVVIFGLLSNWQFDRLNERRESNNLIESALMASPTTIIAVSELDDSTEWQKVNIKGQFIPEDSKVVRKRYFKDKLGFWVITPFELTNGVKILINRGWIQIGEDSTVTPSIPIVDSSQRSINGYLRLLETHKDNPNDLPLGQIMTISNENFEIKDTSLKFYLQLIFDQNNPEIAELETPKLSSGPHLSYAIQWIFFAMFLPIGWYILLKNEE